MPVFRVDDISEDMDSEVFWAVSFVDLSSRSFASTARLWLQTHALQGPKTDPCETPLVTYAHGDPKHSTQTFCCLPLNQFSIQLPTKPRIPCARTLCINLTYGTLSKALAKSKYIASTAYPWSTSSVTLSRNVNKLLRQDRPHRKPWWELRTSLFIRRCSMISSRTIASNTLHTWLVRLAGR